MQNLNDIVLEDVRTPGQWRDVIKAHLRESLPAPRDSQSAELDGHDVMLDGIEGILGGAIGIARFVLFEGEYNESAWKDMISLFYVDNMREIHNNVMRVHLFLGEQPSYNALDPDELQKMQDAYLGYFNIRPIYGDKCCVSYVMLNYDVVRLTCSVVEALSVPFNLCTYDRNVHIKSAQLRIRTFPFFGRDDKLVVCAQADMLMISRYIYRKLGMPELTLKHICQNRSRDKLDVFPTRGISDMQMMDVFYDREICVRDYRGVDAPPSLHSGLHSLHAIGSLITAMLDSGLPVLILIERHVVIANGISEKVYCADWKACQRRFTIYDDSGALIRRLEHGQRPQIPFLGTYSWDEIAAGIRSLRQFSKSAKDGQPQPPAARRDDVTVIVPFFPRVNMDYFALLQTIKANLMLLTGLHAMKRGGPPAFDNMRWNNTRIFLIECTELKKQMARLCAEAWDWMLRTAEDPELADAEREDTLALVGIQRTIYEDIVAAGLPHYYWCLEIPGEIPASPSSVSDIYLYYVFDSAPVVSTDIESVCLNCVRPGKKLRNRLIRQGIEGALLQRYFTRIRANIIVQPITLREKIVANGS